jgi:hypothetical protein
MTDDELDALQERLAGRQPFPMASALDLEALAAIKALREQVLHENECYKTEYGLRIGTIQLLVEARFERDVALMERRGLEAGRDEAVKALEWYREQMCEHGRYFEGCGKLPDDDCAGCRAEAVLSRLKAK